MNEELISKIAKVLEDWNPLGEKANNVEGLDGYRIEAIDIISTLNFKSGPNKVEKAIEQVLTQAFDIELNPAQLEQAAEDVEKLMGAN